MSYSNESSVSAQQAQFLMDSIRKYSGKGDVSAMQDLLNQVSPLRRRRTFIPSAEVLTMNTTPVELIPAPAADEAIIPIAFAGWLDYAGVAYATNLDILIELAGVPTALALFVGTLAATTDTYFYGPVTIDPIELESQAVQVTEGGGDPATGTSDLIIISYYVSEDFGGTV